MKPDQFGVLTVCLLVTTLTSTPVLAQSSVILYGTADLSARFVKNDGSSRRLALAQDGVNSSQLGFRGAEDLGGGLKAGFNLLAGVNADTGTVNAKFWNRQSIVYLSGSFGEIRLGRLLRGSTAFALPAAEKLFSSTMSAFQVNREQNATS